MMLVETDYLIVRYDPAIGGLIRKILTRKGHLFIPAAGKIRQWQERNNICRTLIPAWPDSDDEGEITSFGYSLENTINEIKALGASVEKRKGKTA